jgi:hypothetical protein
VPQRVGYPERIWEISKWSPEPEQVTGTGEPKVRKWWFGALLWLSAASACGGGAGGGGGSTFPAPSPSPPIAAPSPAALQTVQRAAVRSNSETAAVSLQLAAARVFGAAPRPVTGTGAFDFPEESGRDQLQQPGGTETVLFLPASVFVRQPAAATSALPPGKVWISAGLTEYPVLSTNFPQFVLQVEGVNPSFLLGEVAWGAASAAPLGSRLVGTTKTEGYLVQVDLSSAASNAAGPAAASFSRAIGYELQAEGESAQNGANASQTIRVWVDTAGRVVQLQASPPGSGVGTTTVTITSFGVPVHVSEPPKRRIVDIAKLTPGGERENNGGGDSDGA